MELNPHLGFNGECREAFEFYERTLGASITFMLGESNIVHATIRIAGQVVHGADASPEEYEKPRGFALSLAAADPAEAERLFSALSERGIVRMPLQQTFWSPAFGMLVDRYGIPWMINTRP